MWLRLLVVLLASVLQFHQLGGDLRFHPDEAFFMRFARSAAVNGEWLLPGALDKPPLSIYFSALSMAAFGSTVDAGGVLQLDARAGEFAGRLPNVFLALGLAALMMRLARDFYDDGNAALFAGLLTATSPYSLAFGATAFTDMSLLFWSALALWLLLRGRWGWGGLALGFAFWSKQQALFVLPLLFCVRHGQRRWLPPLLCLLVLLLLWDAARPETSLFVLGSVNNAPPALIAEPGLWLARLTEWLGLGAWLLAVPLLGIPLLALAALGWHRTCASGRRAAAPLLLFSFAYLALHSVIAFNPYARYLLLLLPVLAVLVAGGLPYCPHFLRWRWVLAVLLVISAGWALDNAPIGVEGRAHEGIDELADYLNSRPLAAVIYDPWLGWQLGYYMGQWSDKRRVHYPTPSELAAGAQALDEAGDRYFAAPRGQALDAWLAALRAGGFDAQLDYQSAGYVVYRLWRINPR